MTDIVERLRARRAMWLNGLRYCMSTEPDIDCVEAADEIERLRALVKDLADDLESEVKGHYPPATLQYPSEQRCFERDMDSVYRARRALEPKP